ncbi:hypothetical protein KQX54_008855 [Cotesia glomerata]|uniref:Uncharacterized protein n=1 Tax=Cotesia glomerata TaxID=32391 RepID=A0AAV7I699_COTGL|nr:hypothetical protein KQX54_008855 [Cotesia glomerata]
MSMWLDPSRYRRFAHRLHHLPCKPFQINGAQSLEYGNSNPVSCAIVFSNSIAELTLSNVSFLMRTGIQLNFEGLL